jgi:fatty acid desaturase
MATALDLASLRNFVPQRIVRPWRFAFKIAFALTLLSAAAFMALSSRLPIAALGVFLEGLLFAHILELVHSCIHGTGIGVPAWDRVIGVALGLPMLVSYSDYRKNHLEHHRTLGKTEKEDFFGYDFETLNSWPAFAVHLLMLGHYKSSFKNMWRAVTSWKWRDTYTSAASAHVEYLLMILWLAVPVIALAMGNTAVARVVLLPLIVAIPCHVLIELPEHWRCPPSANMMENTRSISASRLATWFTNGNNYHLEHHLFAGLPNESLRAVHALVKKHAMQYEESYWQFYLRFARSLRSRKED